MSRWTNWLLSAAVLLATLALFEWVIFAYVWPAGESPRNTLANGVIKFEPQQSGVYRKGNDIVARWRINDAGWNSGHNQYDLRKTSQAYRVVMIGDSYVEAMQVDYERSAAEQLEALGHGALEVYRFGISGAPLTQYLHMLRREVVNYHPDGVIVVLVHNDFHESYALKQGRYTSSFLKIRFDDDGSIHEVPPHAFTQQWFEPLRQSNIFGFFRYRYPVTLSRVVSLVRSSAAEAPVYQANINVSRLDEQFERDQLVTDYVFRQLQALAQKHGFALLIVMDGDRTSLYSGRPSHALRLNAMAAEVAARVGVPFIDLHPHFARAYREHGARFECASDGHWNEAGHRVVAQVAHDFFMQEGRAR